MRLRGLSLSCAVALLALTAAEARAAPAWCLVSNGHNSFTNCGYFTQRQCLAAVSGVGGFCIPNPSPPGYLADSFEVRRWKKGRYPF